MRKKGIAIALCLVLAACSTVLGIVVPTHNQTVDLSAIPSGRYVLDARHAHLLFFVDHMGFSKAVGRFNRIDAVLTFDNADPQASSLNVTIDPASVDTGDGDLDQILQGSMFFYTAKHPEITFVGSALSVLSPTAGVFAGTLTLRGRSQPVALNVTFSGGARDTLMGQYKLGFSATARFPRSAFGVTGFLPIVGDEVTLMIEAEFVLEPAP